MTRGIRSEWIGLKVRMSKTKQIGVITQHAAGFVVTANGKEYKCKRPDFIVLRNQ